MPASLPALKGEMHLVPLCVHRKLEVYEGDSRVWKENAEWSGSGCCRNMVPIEGSNADSEPSLTHQALSETNVLSSVTTDEVVEQSTDSCRHDHDHHSHSHD